MKETQGAIHFDITGDETDLKRALASSRSAILASGDAAEQQGARIEQMFKRATTGAVAFFSAAKATDFVKSMATVHGEFQSIQIALSTILGSETEANKLFEQLKDTAAKTPFDLKGVASGAKQLLAYGESADTVNDTLIKLGNISAGLSQPLGDIVYLYGTTMTQGRLYTQDLNQFTGRGIPMIRELAKEFGVAESEVKKLVESGKVGFPEVQKVINNLTSETGMFYNLMPRMSEALTGQISNLQDAWDVALDEMGKSSEGFLYSGIEGATYLVEHYDKVLKILGTLIAAYGSYKAALIVINTLQKSKALVENIRLIAMCRKELGLATAAQQAFNISVKANPYVLAISALLTVISALAIFSGHADKAAEAQAELNKNINDEVEKLDDAYKSIKKAKDGTEDRKRAIDNFNSEYGKYLSNLLSEKSTVEEIADAYAEAKRSVVDFQIAKAKSSFLEEPSEDLAKSTRKFYKQLGDWTKELDTTEQQARFTAYVDQILEEVKNGGSFDIHKVYDAFRAAQAKNSYQNIEAWREAMRDGQESFGDSDIDIIDRVGGWDVNQVDFLGKSIQRLQGVLKGAEADFTQFSEVYSDIVNPKPAEDGGKKFKSFAEQVEAAKTRIATLKSELKDLLAGKGDVSNFAQAIEDKRKEISQAEDTYAYLRGFDPKKKSSGTTSSTDYKTKIANEGREIERLYRDLELYTAKARVDSMKEGFEKVLTQNYLNHQMELESIQRQKEDLLRKIQESERTIWEAENPDWKKKGLTFTPTTTELPKEDIEKFDKLIEAVNLKKQKADADLLSEQFDQEVADWNEYYKKYGTFRERLQATKDEYDKKMQDAKNTGEKAALQAELDEFLAEFEVEASGFVEELTMKTTGRLEIMLKDAQKQLEAAQKKFKTLDNSSSTEAKQYRDTINKLQAQIKALQNQLGKAKQTASDKDWAQSAELFQAISSGARDAAEGVRGFDEGLADVLTTIANITAGIGGMISAIIGIGEAASAAEKASAILAVIAAAIQIVSGLFSIFSGGESAVEKTCREFAELNDELIRLKREAAINSWEDTIFGADYYRNAMENIGVYVEAIERYNATLEKIRTRGKEIVGFGSNTDKANLTRIEKSWETAVESISNMQVQTRHSTWFRSAKYASLGSLLPALFNEDGSLNMDSLKEFQGDDLYKKLTKENRAFIDELIADWELYEEALDEVKDYLSDIFGDLGETMTDALVEAFANGTDAAIAFAETVSEMLEDLAKDMIYSVTLAPLMEKAQKEMLAVMGDADLSDEKKFEKYAEILSGVTSDAIAQQENFNALLEKFKEIAAENGVDVFSPKDSSREASERGIATASQESVDENNGRLTVIQSHTYMMNENVKTLVFLGDKMLEAMVAIRTNTEYCRKLDKLDKLDSMYEQLARMKRSVDEITDNGLKVK